jgi:hypothetical protein
MLKGIGVCIDKEAAILLAISTIVPSIQKVAEIWRTLQRGSLGFVSAASHIERDQRRLHVHDELAIWRAIFRSEELDGCALVGFRGLR